MMNRKILQGDVLEKIKEIPDESIDTIITSPPYYALRDYSVDGQIGLEQTPQQYIAKLMLVMTECKRVLKQTGSCWVNIGDSYNGSKIGNTNGTYGQVKQKKGVNTKSFRKIADPTIRIKSKYGIPSRFEVACIDDGWLSRNEIPWIKANCMPFSGKDRFTNKWEPVFFFTKSQKYYFNLDAVREKCITEPKPSNVRVIETKQTKLIGGMSEKQDQEYDKAGIHDKYRDDKNSNACRLHKDREGNPNRKQDNVLGDDGKPKANYKGFNERWRQHNSASVREENKAQDQLNARVLEARKNGAPHDSTCNHPNGKNPGDVFFINPKPYMEAHFATFPVELPKRILRCACPPNGIVLDPFMGAGTTAVAAEELGMQWVGIDLNPKYIEIAKNRLEKYRNAKVNSDELT